MLKRKARHDLQLLTISFDVLIAGLKIIIQLLEANKKILEEYLAKR